MRMLSFGFIAYIFIALEIGLRPLFSIGGVEPSFVLIYMIFLASLAPASAAIWAGLILGLLIDLTHPYPGVDGTVITIAGPHALGFALGALLIIQVRTQVYKKHPLTIAFLTLIAGATTYSLATFLLFCRWLLGSWVQWYAPFAFSPTDELVQRFWIILLSAIIAIPLSWMLAKMSPIFVFQVHPRYGHIR